MDHEQDRPDFSKSTSSAENKDGEAAAEDIELERIAGSSRSFSRQVNQPETHEEDLVTGGAAGAPALAAEVETTRRTTAMKDKEIFSSRIVWICAFFLLLYVVSVSVRHLQCLVLTSALLQGAEVLLAFSHARSDPGH